MDNIAVVLLAAGRGQRMKSDIPKVLHPVCGRPMIGYVLDLIRELKAKRTVAVLGYRHDKVKGFISPGIKTVVQKRLLGTADALKTALPLLKNFKGTILVLYGDMPLIKKDTIKKLLEHHKKNSPDATLLTAEMNKPEGYGRILRDRYSSISGIAEERDADDVQKEIKEVNTGIACFSKDALSYALRRIRPNNRKREYYLTDAIGILYRKGCLIDGIRLRDTREASGINSRADLSRVNRIMQGRINEGLMNEGVSIVDPESTFISYAVRVGRDTTIYPFTVIERDVKIGRHCFLGPFAHIREGSRIEDGAVIGNFIEVVRSRISRETLAKHFAYIGDSRIGRRVNIGAGTVTANFDGKKKNISLIKDGAFIGSDTVLVAPVTIGRHSVTGAGSVVTRGRRVNDRTTVVGVPARPLKTKR